MKLVVLVKQVPVVSQMAFDAATRTLKRDGVRLEVSSFDLRAVTRAVEIRDAVGGEVIVCTMGPPQARDALEHCLAFGADRALHLVDPAFAGADTLATARVLARALEREGFDLVLCGRASTDAETGQVGPEVAELLGIPQITCAARLDVDPTTRMVSVVRETDDGLETVAGPLPVLVTAGEDLAPERFLRKAEKEAARDKPVTALAAATLGLAADQIGLGGSPTWVGPIEVREDRRAGTILKGEPMSVVAQLVRELVRRGALRAPPAAATSALGDAPVAVTRDEGPVPEAGIWVVGEVTSGRLRRVTLELLGKARELAERRGVEAVVMLLGDAVSQHAHILAHHGATRTLVAEAPVLASYATEPYTSVLARAVGLHRPAAVLLPSTYVGRDLAPRLAARLGLGLTGDCIDLTLDDEGRLVQWKPAFGGNVVAPILSKTSPDVATVRPGVLPVATALRGRVPVVTRLPADGVAAPLLRTVERRSLAGVERAALLDEAPIAIGVGMGLGGPEALAEIATLATACGGAALASTRDVSDAGWLPRQHQVGLTGRSIAPALFLAIGIRGASEHTVGLRRAGTIVAINKNPKAPIFAQADFGIVAEWQTILGPLAQAIRGARSAAR